MARASTNKCKTVFHEEKVPLFFYDGDESHEDEVVFINKEVLLLNVEERGIYDEYDISHENFEWFLMKSMILLVLHRLSIIWSKLNETISRHFE